MVAVTALSGTNANPPEALPNNVTGESTFPNARSAGESDQVFVWLAAGENFSTSAACGSTISEDPF